MAVNLSTIEQLLACQELTRLKAMYCRFVDTKDWAGFESLFASNASLDFRGSTSTSVGDHVLQGSSVIAETIRRATLDVTTVHQCHTPEFDIVSPTQAKAVWHMFDHLRWQNETPVRSRSGYGYYHETYEKIEGEWKILSVRLERTMIEAVTLA